MGWDKMMKTRSLLVCLFAQLVLGGLFASAQDAPSIPERPSQVENYEPVTSEEILNPADGDWLAYRRTLNSWGYSPLDQINRENVGELRLAWSRAMEPGLVESTPLVHDGVMYLPSPGDVIQAIDGATGDLIWEYRRQLPEEGLYATGVLIRGMALYEDKLFFVSWDNFVVALDASTGQLVWETQRSGELSVSNSTGPIMANGVVVTGSTCAYTYPGGCYAAGYDAESGEELWLNYPVPRPGEEGDETWAGLPLEARIHTGVWGALSYDPELDLVYYGSSSTAPSSPTLRGTEDAELLYTNTRFAVRPQTGEIVWKRQIMPGAYWDEECTFEAVIVETPVNPNPDAEGMLAVGANLTPGETRKVHTGMPCKTGTIWTLDAETGEFLWAKQTVYQNMIASIDDEGTVTVNQDSVLTEVGQPYFVCPTFLGGRDWAPVAYDPDVNVLFIPLNNLCADMTAFEEEGPALSYQVESTYQLPPENQGNIGRIDAVSVETGETLWTYEQRAAHYSPVMATGGGLLFGGSQDRVFRAHDSENGNVLWEIRLPSDVSGHAMTYEAGGVQYVAVATGGSLAGSGLAAFTPDVDFATGSNAVFVFALPGSVVEPEQP